jgi:hypothetical protein
MSGVDILAEVKRDMAFIGWKGDRECGFSHKEDVDGNVIARHHDATWVADVEECTARAERLAARREIERRAFSEP